MSAEGGSANSVVAEEAVSSDAGSASVLSQDVATSNIFNAKGRDDNQPRTRKTQKDKLISSEQQDFSGAMKDFSYIMGMRYEQDLVNKVSYEKFKRNFISHIECNSVKYGDELANFLRTGKDPKDSFKLPSSSKKRSELSYVEELELKAKFDIYHAATQGGALDRGMKDLYNMVWGQCTLTLQGAISRRDDYEEESGKRNVQWLLTNIKEELAGIDKKSNPYSTWWAAFRKLANMRQQKQETASDFLKRQREAVELFELAGGKGSLFSETIAEFKAHGADKKDIEAEKQKLLAVHLVEQGDPARCKDLWKSLVDGTNLGRDEYPLTQTDALNLLMKHTRETINLTDMMYDRANNAFGRFPGRGGRFGRGRVGRDGRFQLHGRGGRGRGRSNTSGNSGAPPLSDHVPGRDENVHEGIECHACSKYGHYANQCPDREGYQGVQYGVMLSQSESKDGLHLDGMLLDSGATDSGVHDLSLVKNVRTLPRSEHFTVKTNGGSMVYTKDAELKIFPMRVYVNEDSTANILSMKDLEDVPGLYITYDSRIKRGFLVHYEDKVYTFEQSKEGLYFLEEQPRSNKLNKKSAPYIFVQTVANNKTNYSSAEIRGADYARRQQQQMMWPSDSFFKHIITNNLTNNNKVTNDDIDNGISIYGKQRQLYEGKMTRPTSTKAIFQRYHIPKHIQDRFSKGVQIELDIMFVNRIPFVHSRSQLLDFKTIKRIIDRCGNNIKKACKLIFQKYERRGLKITDFHGDNEFELDGLEEYLGADSHICAADEHIGGIERQARTIKERARCATHNLPYRVMPRIMVISLLEDIVKWLNAFPTKGGASKTLSPSSIVEGKGKPNMGYERPVFGSYCMAYTQSSNGQKARSVPAIALKEANDRGSHYFMNLLTGEQIHSHKWDELPIGDDVIQQVEALGLNQGQPEMNRGQMLFEWDIGVPIDEDDVLDYDAPEINDGADDGSDGEVAYDGEHEGDDVSSQNIENQDDIVSAIEEVADSDADANSEYEISDDEEDNVIEEMYSDHSDNEHFVPIPSRPKRSTAGVKPKRYEADLNAKKRYDSVLSSEDEPEENEGDNLNAEERRQFLQVKMKHHQFMMRRKRMKTKDKMKKDPNTMFHRALHVMFTQMSAKHGIKTFGEEAVAAMFKEMKQLNQGAMPGKPVVIPVDVANITKKEKKEALNAINLIKRKRDESLKGRTCADGSRQRAHMSEDESIYSPTVTTEGLLTSMAIAVFEGRDTATFDVPGAYLHAEMPEGKTILMRFKDEFVDIMCKVNPEHKRNVIYEKGKKVLYVRVKRAIYGCIESALLWYDLYKETLEKMGFKLNEYDKCIANKSINGKQCTIAWYVDDNFVSHADSEVVTDILETMKKEFGDIKITRGKKHTFLGINFEFKDDKVLAINMVEQLEETIALFGEEICGNVTSCAAKGLTTIDANSPPLDEKKAKIFHSVVAKLLFITKRARPDIEPTVNFLCTRVTKSTEQDWTKLKRLMIFIKNTLHDKRFIGMKGVGEMFTWVDAAYAVYDDMRSQTGGAMSFGLGVIHCKTSRQKLNTKSSTESELVGVSDYIPYNIWMTMFLREQGMVLYKNILYQDNQSAIKMEKNGKESCTGNSRHIDIRYFFVKDRVKKKEVEIVYCPTEQMLADYFTKPLQGSLFIKFRRVIMGYDPISVLKDFSTSKMKERVERSDESLILDEQKISEKSEAKEVSKR